MPMRSHEERTKELIRLALEEDIGTGDKTALAVPEGKRARAKLVAKESCVVSGLELPELVLGEMRAAAHVELHTKNGDALDPGALVLLLEGDARQLLSAERTILNFLQRLFGIATQARRCRDLVAGQKIAILDTRKTTPGLRYWEKKAVRDGGLNNHRMSLEDGILVKENHIRAAGSITRAVENLRVKAPKEMPIEVEVTNWEEIQEAVASGAGRLLLDNFEPAQLTVLVPKIRLLAPSIYLEASGGVTEQNLLAFATSGVDAMSMGALTHSIKSSDLSLLFDFL